MSRRYICLPEDVERARSVLRSLPAPVREPQGVSTAQLVEMLWTDIDAMLRGGWTVVDVVRAVREQAGITVSFDGLRREIWARENGATRRGGTAKKPAASRPPRKRRVVTVEATDAGAAVVARGAAVDATAVGEPVLGSQAVAVAPEPVATPVPEVRELVGAGVRGADLPPRPVGVQGSSALRGPEMVAPATGSGSGSASARGFRRRQLG